MKFNKTGQNVLEYAILITVVLTALMAISLYVRRSIYANLLQIQRQTNYESTQ
jgi:hypothetical protein